MPTEQTLEERLDALKTGREQVIAIYKKEGEKFKKENEDWHELLQLVNAKTKKLNKFVRKAKRDLEGDLAAIDMQIEKVQQEMLRKEEQEEG